MKLAGLVRVLRTILTFYSALHLLVLHLFQLSSAQSHIQDGPCHVADCSQTSSLLARLVLVVCVLEIAMVLYIGILEHLVLLLLLVLSPACRIGVETKP